MSDTSLTAMVQAWRDRADYVQASVFTQAAGPIAADIEIERRIRECTDDLNALLPLLRERVEAVLRRVRHQSSCPAVFCRSCGNVAGYWKHYHPHADSTAADHQFVPGPCTCGADEDIKALRETI